MKNNEPLWSPRDPASTRMEKFRVHVNEKHGLNLKNYHDLWEWSTTDIENFWASVWKFCGVRASAAYTEVLEKGKSMDQIPKWFSGAKLNFAENMLSRRDDHVALIGADETERVRKVTYAELYSMVRDCAAAMRKAGIKPGDRIVGYVPNSPETVAIMLAAASVGAIWSSASPDFGTTGVLERFTQISPKILFSVNGVYYNGRVHDHLDKVRDVVKGLPSLEHVVILPFVDQQFDASSIPKAKSYEIFIRRAEPANDLVFEQLPFDHPLVVLYSSGTTGKPKCIVHSAGGVLLQHLKEHLLHGNIKETDVFFYYTTTGWMMWNWLISGLATGCTVVTYDGSPFKPTPLKLWQMVDSLKITIFGTSAKYIQSLEASNIKPASHSSYPSLHSIYTTGSPLPPESFDFIYQNIKKDILLGSITGGTDIVSLFAGHNAALPVHRGEIQCQCLGMRIEAWTDEGKAVLDEPADLVCTKPFPVMPIYFWNDEKNEKYRKAYFDEFEGVWHHGDYVQINSQTGGVVMLGRSDGTLNPGGIRFGSAEIYNILEVFPTIADSLVVGQKWNADERVVLFCKMTEGKTLEPDLIEAVKERIKSKLSARHVPAVILPIADIPYTLTGKKVEIAVKKIISGEKVTPSGALANPASLELFYDIPELQMDNLIKSRI